MESLDIRKLNITSYGATVDIYMGFGEWKTLEFKKDENDIGVFTLPEYEDVFDDKELCSDLEELVDGICAILSATLNIFEDEKG